MNPQPTLFDLQILARQAGVYLRAGYGHMHVVHHKGDRDVVTEIDRRSEEFLLENIRRRFPGHAIVTEESGYFAGQGEACWYIDPLDGTSNYTAGLPHFSVSIAFVEKKQVQLAAIYDPLRDECFSAELGKGARLNDQPIHVSPQGNIQECVFGTGFTYGKRDKSLTNLKNYDLFSTRALSVRRLGSAALDMSYVACGRLHGYWVVEVAPWDIAAGSLIVTEAGGVITDLAGGPNYNQPPYSFVAAGPAIHPQMLDILREARESQG